MSKGKVIVVSGPSGAGKSSVLKKILAENPDFYFSVSATTREIRPGEVDGVSYHYITVEEFQRLLEENNLLEYNHYGSGDYYGTPAAPVREVLERGGVAVLDIDANGARQVREIMPDAVLIYLAPPSFQDLKQRLIDRKDTPMDKILRRMETAKWERTQAYFYDYVIVNVVLEQAIEDMRSILRQDAHAADLTYEKNHHVPFFEEVL